MPVKFDHLDPDAPPPSESQILVSYFRSAAANLKRIVLHPPGKTKDAQDFRLGRAANMLGQVRTIIDDLKGKSVKWTGATITKAITRGQSIADAQLKSAGVLDDKGALKGSFSQIDPRVAAAFARDSANRQKTNAGDAVGDLVKAASSMQQRAERTIRATQQQGLDEDQINEVLAKGSILGQRDETIRALREDLKAIHGERVIAGKMTFDVGDYAKMVAITKTRQATEIARHQRMAESGLDLVRIVGRVSNNFCTAFLSQVFSLSGSSSKYPALSSLPSGGPPFHPNCSKSTAPFVEELATDVQQAAAEPTPETEKLQGMSPAQAQRAYKDLQLRPEVQQREERVVKSIGGTVNREDTKARSTVSGTGAPPVSESPATRRSAPKQNDFGPEPLRPQPKEPRKSALERKTESLRQQLEQSRAAAAKQTEAMMRQLERTRQARIEAQQQLAEARAELDRMRAELAALMADSAANRKEIADLTARIAAAEARSKALDRAIARAERKQEN